jgi:putative spermidine/putrescine transport system substrate-binding protein
MTWVNDAHYMVVPKGISAEKLAVVLDVMAFMLTPEAQAYTYDKGYFYPGEGCAAFDGAESESGSDQGVRPPRIREVAC